MAPAQLNITQDTPETWAHVNTAQLKKYANIPKIITPNTPPSRKKSEALLKPDADKWRTAIDQGLEKLDKRMAVDWTTKAEPKHRPIPFILNFEYKRDKTKEQ